MTQRFTGVILLGLAVAGWSAAQDTGKLAPVNEFKGMQEREEVFEFAEKPAVKKDGDRWVITFASKGKCDATIAILDKDGKIVRHLASGVLGPNAPHPFQQDSLSQKIAWDGLTTDFKKAEPAGCKVRVSLGLRAKYDRSIAYDPTWTPGPKKGKPLVGTGSDGTVYLAISEVENESDAGCVAFDKDGNYLRTVIPPAAADIEKAAPVLKFGLRTTKWGDKVPACGWFGPFRTKKHTKDIAPLMSKLVPGVEFKQQDARPANLKSNAASGMGVWNGMYTHLFADQARDEVYACIGGQIRFIGKTGKRDGTWFPDPEKNLGASGPSELSVGPDGLIYVRFGPGGKGRHMIRMDHEGKPIPFKKEYTVEVPGGNGWWTRLPSAFAGGIDAVFCGVGGHSMVFQSGLCVAPNGQIVMGIHEVQAKWAGEHGIISKEEAERLVAADKKSPNGAEIRGNYNPVFDLDGKLLSANSVGETCYGQGVTMDRDGNIYTVFGGCMPEGVKDFDGCPGMVPANRQQGGFGCLIKFRGRGGQFPLDQGGKVIKLWRQNGGKAETNGGALWAYGGMCGQSSGDCQCHHMRFDMDYYARAFIPSAQLFSVTVLDANMNRVARFGRYGNPDDTEADIKSGKGDGIRIAWMRAAAVSDAAVYVVDPANRRILRAGLSYAAEETVPVP